MIIQCITENKDVFDLTFNKNYFVLAIAFWPNGQPVRAVIQRDSDGTPCLFDLTYFSVVDEKYQISGVLLIMVKIITDFNRKNLEVIFGICIMMAMSKQRIYFHKSLKILRNFTAR